MKALLFFKSLLFSVTIFLFWILYIPQVHAGHVTSMNHRSDFSSPGCSNSGISLDTWGSGPKTFTFSAWSGLPDGAHCQISIYGKGEVSSSNMSGSVAAGGVLNLGFSTQAEEGDNGDNTSWGLTIDIGITAPAPTPTSTPAPTPPPSPPGGFIQNSPQTACSGSSPQIVLSWEPASGATGYKVIYFDAEGGGTIDNNLTTAGRNYTLTASNGLIRGHQYSFMILATNAASGGTYSDNSTWSHTKFGTFTTFPDCNPPASFEQSKPLSVCNGIIPGIALSWEESANAEQYKVIFFEEGTDEEVDKDLTTTETGYVVKASDGFVSGHNYSFIIYSMNRNGSIYSDNSTWSNAKFGAYTTFPDCNPPAVNLWINGQPHTEIPLTVNQNSTATLTWQINNVTAANTSSDPAQLYWNGPLTITAGSSNGSKLIDTSIPGTYLFTATGINSFSGLTMSGSIQLNVRQYPLPFFQTTGGDVHTNESIYTSPNTP